MVSCWSSVGWISCIIRIARYGTYPVQVLFPHDVFILLLRTVSYGTAGCGCQISEKHTRSWSSPRGYDIKRYLPGTYPYTTLYCIEDAFYCFDRYSITAVVGNDDPATIQFVDKMRIGSFTAGNTYAQLPIHTPPVESTYVSHCRKLTSFTHKVELLSGCFFASSHRK